MLDTIFNLAYCLFLIDSVQQNFKTFGMLILTMPGQKLAKIPNRRRHVLMAFALLLSQKIKQNLPQGIFTLTLWFQILRGSLF